MTSVFHWKIFATVCLCFIAGECHESVNICKSVSDKWELLDSARDMADIGDEYFALESLEINKMPSTSKKIDIMVLTLPKLDKTCKS